MVRPFKPTARQDGKYRYKVLTAEGKWVQEVGYKDKKATVAQMEKRQAEEDRKRAGLFVESQNKVNEPIANVIQAYIRELERLGRSAKYISHMKWNVERLCNGCGWLALRWVERESLLRHLERLADKGQAASTQNQELLIARIFVKWCVDNDYLKENPLRKIQTVKAVAQGPRKRRAFSPEEFRRLAQHGGQRAVLYQIAGLSGLRKEELRLLEVQDFTLGERPQWHLRPQIQKGKRDARAPMLPECADVLASLAEGKGPTDRIFKSVPRCRTVNADLKRAGIPKKDERGRQVDLHSLRYFFCSELGKRLPIQVVKVLMRHKDIRTTMNIYMDLGLEDIHEAVVELPSILGNPGGDEGKDEECNTWNDNGLGI